MGVSFGVTHQNKENLYLFIFFFNFLTISPIFLNISVSRNNQTGPLPTKCNKLTLFPKKKSTIVQCSKHLPKFISFVKNEVFGARVEKERKSKILNIQILFRAQIPHSELQTHHFTTSHTIKHSTKHLHFMLVPEDSSELLTIQLLLGNRDGSFVCELLQWMLRVNEANKGFNKMKWSSSPSEWKNEWIRLTMKTRKNEKEKQGMHSQTIKDEWQMMNNEYKVYCMITIQYFEWLVNASISISISFVNPYSFILVIYSLQSALLV